MSELSMHEKMPIFVALYACSTDPLQLQLSMSFGPYIKSVEQLIKLRPAHRHRLAVGHPWPDESLLLQTLRPKNQAIALPVQDADPIASSIAEHIQRCLEDIALQSLLHQQRQGG